jgi:hypothetical protein
MRPRLGAGDLISRESQNTLKIQRDQGVTRRHEKRYAQPAGSNPSALK